jgi:hypothetical protein
VIYINEVVKVRSNWDNNIAWDVSLNPAFTKDIRDRELEEQMQKEAEEKAARERESIDNDMQQQQNNMFQPGNSSPGSVQPIRR